MEVSSASQAKNRSKQATTLIPFFQRKLRVHTLRMWKRGAKRGQEKVNFSLKLLVKMKKSNLSWNFKLKLALPWPPFWPPFSKFVKYGLSAISGKKINVVACLDRFLAWLALRLPYLAG